MSLLRCLLAIVCAVAATACQSSLPELRQDPRAKHAFHIAAPYEVIRRNVENTIRFCHPGYSTGALNSFDMVVEPIPGNGTNVTYWQRGINNRPMFSVDMAERGDGTDVTFYHGSGYAVFSDFGPRVREWALGSGKCGGGGSYSNRPSGLTALPPETAITPL